MRKGENKSSNFLKYSIIIDFVHLPHKMQTESQSTIISTEKLRVKRSPMELSQSTAVCERFSEPLSNNTFFSPIDTTMLSDNYPPEVDCILIISGE